MKINKIFTKNYEIIMVIIFVASIALGIFLAKYAFDIVETLFTFFNK
jgi:hypothetical protein